MSPAAISHRSARRLAGAIIDRELARLRGRTSAAGPAFGPIRSGREDLADLDSLEQLGAIAAICEVFRLEASSLGPRFPADLDDWAGRIVASSPTRFVVRSSGSTGEPKACSHAFDDLRAEAEWFAAALPASGRVVSMVPADHLYGAIWTVFLPEVLEIDVVEASLPGLPELSNGDLVVAVPDQWAALARIPRLWPRDAVGVSSAGSIDAATVSALGQAGLSRLLDVYGSSETGAIGCREAFEAVGPDGSGHDEATGYRLLPRWGLRRENGEVHLFDRKGLVTSFPDRIEECGEGRIRPTDRHDRAVKVGGQTVHPSRVEGFLESLDGVERAAVRLGTGGRLKAFIVVDSTQDENEMEVRLRSAAGKLSPAERPTGFRFGPALPRNAMGKLQDWT